MTSATDIITYIGVPLAVLGVLPILYTFLLAIITQRRIRASLIHHGHKPISSTRPHDGFSIRSSPMTSLIEVELPRYTIAPLERNREDYWKLNTAAYRPHTEHHRLLERTESTLSMIEEGRVQGFLRGGSWRSFHFKKLIVGRKLYRIQYEDELREPPAEIDFSQLVHFLLDWGTVPDSMGWEKLRSGGLWTPSGTILLRKPEAEDAPNKAVDWVLRTSVPDESNGVLTLSVRWTKDMDGGALPERGAASLPPGWGRIRQPVPEIDEDEVSKKDLSSKPLSAMIEELRTKTKVSAESNGVRFRIEDNRISTVYWESSDMETGFSSEPFRLHEQSLAGLWFTCVASALTSRNQPGGGFWGYEIPFNITSFAQKDSVPCGVIVILGVLDEKDAPEWSSEQSVPMNGFNMVANNPAALHHQRFTARQAAERLEATMPPEQARIHRMNREAAERALVHHDMQTQRAARIEKEERRIKDAIASPKTALRMVAEAALRWLIAQKVVGREYTIEQLAEAVLYLLVVDQSLDGEASRIVNVLQEWMDWTQAGGMKRQQVDLLMCNKRQFCLATSLVLVVAEAAGRPGQGATDMLECLKMWRKVRLG